MSQHTIKSCISYILYNILYFFYKQMVTQLLSHLIVALVIYYLTIKNNKKIQRKPQLKIKEQFAVTIGKEMQDFEIKRKSKKQKKKLRMDTEENQQPIKTIQDRIIQHVIKQQAKQSQADISKTQKHQQNTQIQTQIQEITKVKAYDQNQSKEEQQLKTVKKNHQDSVLLQKLVLEQLQLIRSYFMQDVQQIVPYNGQFGSYKLTLQGSLKQITLQWNYDQNYPKQIVSVSVSKQNLNPLQKQKLQAIMKEQKVKATQQDNYHYIFNLATAIYQDLMMLICQEQDPSIQPNKPEQTSQPNQEQLKAKREEEMKAKKQIYGKIVDQIFYLHDLVQKPDISAMKTAKEQSSHQHQHRNGRGRFAAQFWEMEMIGEGGFGKVYKVKHKLDGNIYAIKKTVINYQDHNDRKMLKQVAMLSKMNHPNIVRYYQSWLQDVESIQDIMKDMSFGSDQKQKYQQLNQIYQNWKNNKSDIMQKQSNSQYSISEIENSDIVFDYQQNSDIAFEDDQGESMQSKGSSIQYIRDQSQGSVIEELQQCPFKILYIAMEMCSGTNLRKFIDQRFEQDEKKVQILRGILEGVAYIHSKKMIHRDLKPANIFLTDNDKVKIGDFGLATLSEKATNASNEQSLSDFVSEKTRAVGTGFYRAPQQIHGVKYDEKADIYSLGIIMFEMFFKFGTAMQRSDILKGITQTHNLPKEFKQRNSSDLVQHIPGCLKQNAGQRPTATKILQKFRSKYFTQLVSVIANPDHFQFSELLYHLFAIRNQPGALVMLRDHYKSYMTSKILKVYQIHKATNFPTLPLIPVQDITTINRFKIPAQRHQKYLLINSRGTILEYSNNALKPWLKYAKDAMRRKRVMEIKEQRQPIRRFTFEKIVSWQASRAKQDFQRQFHEKMITAFDLTYKLQQFNPFYFCQALKISQAIVMSLGFTQKRPPILICHSLIFELLAVKYDINRQLFYTFLTQFNQQLFQSLSLQKRVSYLQQNYVPNNLSKKLCTVIDKTFQNGLQLLQQLQLQSQNQIFQTVAMQMLQFQKTKQGIIQNPVKWKLNLPLPTNCLGFYWQVAVVKGITSVQEYAKQNGRELELCNYHVQTNLDQSTQEADVSLWCIGQFLKQTMHKLIVQCWKNGLTTRWYDQLLGEKELRDTSRSNIILRRKNQRVQMMFRLNQLRRGEQELKQSSFMNLEQLKDQALKQIVNFVVPSYYH